jgi:uncharacterized protein YyaL (SSP411 family)
MRFIYTIALALTISSCSAPEHSTSEAYSLKKGTYPIRTQHRDENGDPIFTNRLIHENSPYLLQHAHNPVDWWAWEPAAFEQAKTEDKPILLSVGYSTCHWCHVMERESFESLPIAEYINEHFIPIKVDREEHPDIDETYLTAVQMLSGKVGWPLTAVLTPNAEPFFGGTYFPPEQFLALLTKINTTWSDNRPAIAEQANRLKSEMAKLSAVASAARAIDRETIQHARRQIASNLFAAPRYNEPGFPREPEMLFLLEQGVLHTDEELIGRLTRRLDTLADSGLHDHVGGGFHRYSVDSEWRIPHFEKMLYNQAQIAQLYAKAYQFTANPRFKDVATRTFNFMLSQYDSEQQGFYSAMDAESDGGEGKFYTWSFDELESILSDAELDVAVQHLSVTSNGNFEGKNVLWRTSRDRVAATQTDQLLAKLATIRQQRSTPATDHKIITAWNGLAISALVSGFEATGEDKYRQIATTVAESLWENAYQRKKGLARIAKQGGRIEGALDDYANLVRSYLDLYDVTQNLQWLERSETLTERMISDFLDQNTGAFLISNQHLQRGLVVPIITARDDAMYSGNSVATQNLARLFHRTGNNQYRDRARAVIAHFSSQLVSSPESASGMLLAASLLTEGDATTPHYVARGKVRVASTLTGHNLVVTVAVDDGWHINGDTVLNKYLIPTTLIANSANCGTLESITFPEPKTVQLGFQSEPLRVFDGTTSITARVTKAEQECRVLGFTLRVQACSDEVCLSPADIPLRHSAHREPLETPDSD